MLRYLPLKGSVILFFYKMGKKLEWPSVIPHILLSDFPNNVIFQTHKLFSISQYLQELTYFHDIFSSSFFPSKICNYLSPSKIAAPTLFCHVLCLYFKTDDAERKINNKLVETNVCVCVFVHSAISQLLTEIKNL